MADRLGRDLYPWEAVHHRNGDRADNRPENLEIWIRHHPVGQRLDDIVDFIARYYPEAVEAALHGRRQLRLVS
jgi:hypothetical protein